MFEIFSSDSVADQCPESIIQENQTVDESIIKLALKMAVKEKQQMLSSTAHPAAGLGRGPSRGEPTRSWPRQVLREEGEGPSAGGRGPVSHLLS